MTRYLSPGEAAWARNEGLLVCDALGSCIGVAAYVRPVRMGFMLHVMLPGRCPEKNDREALRYAENAVEYLDAQLRSGGFTPPEAGVCLAGGANVLQREDDTICESNIRSVEAALAQSGFGVVARSLGGTLRRTLSLEVAGGTVRHTLGDAAETVLYRYRQ